MRHFLYEDDLYAMIQNYYEEDIIELIFHEDYIEIIIEGKEYGVKE